MNGISQGNSASADSEPSVWTISIQGEPSSAVFSQSSESEAAPLISVTNSFFSILIVVFLQTFFDRVRYIADDTILVYICELAGDAAGNESCLLVYDIVLVADNAAGAGQLGVYAEQLKSRKLSCRTVTEFTMKLLMRADSPLAKYDDVPIEELKKYVQILHGDDEMNLFGKNCVNAEFDDDPPHRILHVYDRGSKMALMSILKDAYMWVSPMPNNAFPADAEVVVKDCSYANIRMRDLVICKKSSENNRLIKEFLEFLNVFVDKAFGPEKQS